MSKRNFNKEFYQYPDLKGYMEESNDGEDLIEVIESDYINEKDHHNEWLYAAIEDVDGNECYGENLSSVVLSWSVDQFQKWVSTYQEEYLYRMERLDKLGDTLVDAEELKDKALRLMMRKLLETEN